MIETGTYLGQTVDDLENAFANLYSIELEKTLFQKAKRIFSKSKNIKIIRGDSAQMLPILLRRINKPCLFWLDAHYSGGITAKGTKETSIMQELAAISKNKIKRHIILIDDAREFTGKGDYPTIKKLETFVNKNFPNYRIKVKSDIIRVYPHEPEILEK